MASAHAPSAASQAGRRQSARQARTSTTRPSGYYSRPVGGRHSAQAAAERAPEAIPGFYPAITHFTDSITALPKEIIKHFSMLREVEAKAHAPDAELRVLATAALELPPPAKPQPNTLDENWGTLAGFGSTQPSVANSAINGSAPLTRQPTTGEPADASQAQDVGQDDLGRRRIFHRMRFILQDMALILDEKNAVLATANQAMSKQLARMNSSYSHIDGEISYEARCGSVTHWAYVDRELKKTPGSAANDRTRRDVASANNLAAAAAAVHESESAHRSESRREAMNANKRHRHHIQDSDFEERGASQSKKTGASGRAKKVADPDTKAHGGGGAKDEKSTKRRKTEKGLAGTNAEKSKGEGGHAAAAGGGRATGKDSRAAVGGDTVKRKPKTASAQGVAKKRNQAGAAQSPPNMPMPLHGNLNSAKEAGISVPRPSSSKTRQPSSNNVATLGNQDGKARPSSSVSNRPADLAHMAAATAAPGSHRSVLQDGVKAEEASQGFVGTGTPPALGLALKSENFIPPASGGPEDNDQVMTNSAASRTARSSKTATPVNANFPESVTMSRSRSARNNGNGATSIAQLYRDAAEASAAGLNSAPKRSQKKGAVTSSSPANIPATASNAASSRQPANRKVLGPAQGESEAAAASRRARDRESEEEGDAEEVDDEGEEQLYCYCNNVSYGEMVACDNEDCPKEWFHLKCAGLSRLPSTSSTWYCDDCKESLRRNGPTGR